jgi:YidC/Oxa1 family membrane protein insertase
MLLSTIVDLFRASLFALAHWCGGSIGAAIVVAAAALRIAMLPVSLRATRRRLVREAKLRALAPELAALKRRYRDRPTELGPAMNRLYEAHGVAPFDRASFVDSLLQFPPAAALYAAVRGLPRGAGRFLWMTDMVSPDRALAAVTALVTAILAWVAATSGESGRAAQFAPIITGVITFAILSHISAGVALYSLTNSVIGGTEQVLARRMLERATP